MESTCCVFGHRTIPETEQLKEKLRGVVEMLITKENVDTFLFGSKSRFNDLCLACVTSLKAQYPHVKRVYVRAEYPDIKEDYRAYLLQHYEDTYYPKRIRAAGKAVYVERNCDMIDSSRFCIVYYDERHAPTTRKSGTKIALDYAILKDKTIVNVAGS